MDPRGQESGTEYVLDNRKLIVGFLFLIVACGAFFAIGFMEGKRQSVLAPVQAPQPADSAAPEGKSPGTQAYSPAAPAAQPATDPKNSMRDRLEWYKNVQGGKSESASGTAESPNKAAAGAAKIVEVPRAGAAKTEAPPAGAAVGKTAAPVIKSGRVSYTVQVGAFTQRREAEIKADALKVKGFASIIEEPKPPDQFYRVKVGKFDTRAEAVAMQRKLTKAGFICIIKTN